MGIVKGIEIGRLEGKEEGKVEGKAEGKAEGILEGKMQVYRNLLKRDLRKRSKGNYRNFVICRLFFSFTSLQKGYNI